MSADVEQRAGAGPVDRDNPAPLGAKRIFIQAKGLSLSFQHDQHVVG